MDRRTHLGDLRGSVAADDLSGCATNEEGFKALERCSDVGPVDAVVVVGSRAVHRQEQVENSVVRGSAPTADLDPMLAVVSRSGVLSVPVSAELFKHELGECLAEVVASQLRAGAH